MSLCWGIAGASKISHDFCIALSHKFTPHDHEVIAVASRTKAHADLFAKNLRIPSVKNSFENLAADDRVEVVFVAVLNPFHYDICKMMIEYGKHVLCAKPMCMNQKQVKDLQDLARYKGVFLMEGLWSRFFPVYRYLSELIDFKSLSDVKEVYVKHGYNATNLERITKNDKGGGIVLNIGIDAIQFVMLIYREKPKSIRASGKINSEGVDLHVEVEMIFSDDRKAIITCSGLQACTNQATIISKKGVICIPDYNCPTKLFGCTGAHEWSLISTAVPMNFTNTLGLRFEADEVKKCIQSGRLECDIILAEETLLIAEIQDEVRKQIGVRYYCDRI